MLTTTCGSPPDGHDEVVNEVSPVRQPDLNARQLISPAVDWRDGRRVPWAVFDVGNEEREGDVEECRPRILSSVCTVSARAIKMQLAQYKGHVHDRKLRRTSASQPPGLSPNQLSPQHYLPSAQRDPSGELCKGQ